MNERTQNGKAWAKTGLLAALTVVALVWSYGTMGHWGLLVYATFTGLPILGWYLGLWLADKDAAQ